MDYVDIGFRSGDLCNSKSMGSFRKRDNKHNFSKNVQKHCVFGGLVAFHSQKTGNSGKRNNNKWQGAHALYDGQGP